MSNYHLEALQLARENRWDESHALIQQYNDDFSNLIHAFLHRVEGDIANANYWYRQAGEENPGISTADELDDLFSRVQKS
ncbi:MAG: hypothetical protein KTR32_14470, partial [Granulosicoccus sp.]|nr:hypothetical protein [Granulosicoccus sp.]